MSLGNFVDTLATLVTALSRSNSGGHLHFGITAAGRIAAAQPTADTSQGQEKSWGLRIWESEFLCEHIVTTDNVFDAPTTHRIRTAIRE